MRSVSCPSAAIIWLLLFVLGASGAAAQSLSSVQGFVSDDTGAGLPGVAVELLDLERGQRRTVVTNPVGFFAFRALSSGEYRLDAALSGFRSVRRESLRLQVGQSLDVDLRLGLASIEETVVVTADAPLLEVGRGGAAGYVSEEEMEALPLSGRDFVRFALLQPTVQVDARGSVSLSGQRGVNTGFTIDGASAKSAFFGFGRGGLAREGGGNLVAQESVREFQVVTSGYAAEAGRSGGGGVNVVTKSGTNEISGSSFLFLRDHRMVARLPRSPLDAARGVAVDDDRYAVDEFRRYNWGASLGGPIRRDRTHFFLSYDQTAQDQPFLRDIRGRGQYDAVLARFPELLAGFRPNDDGIAAADADGGRTASGQFVRDTDNLILFGKLNHRVNDRHSLILSYNFADYGRVSDFVGEESRRFVESHSVVGSLVSVVGRRGVNELRFQHAYDHLDRSSHLPASTVQAGFQIFSPSFGSFGKPWWLPVFNHERNFELRERFSLLSGNHELRMGLTFSRDTLSEFFAGNADGSYDFDTVADFAAGRPARARIYFGSVAKPNFRVAQHILGVYAQDSWRPNPRLTCQRSRRSEGISTPDVFRFVVWVSSGYLSTNNNNEAVGACAKPRLRG
ncbi:MAG: carboxypeptidase regulatory-like domain-containing protein, partial [Acidobacteria bacterium]|nr:carboxypeptidase regulatory-like domain-containing protein [Acidobacteriota bacterium]